MGEHCFKILKSILVTFSARKGRDQLKRSRPSGSEYGGSVSAYYFSYRLLFLRISTAALFL